MYSYNSTTKYPGPKLLRNNHFLINEGRFCRQKNLREIQVTYTIETLWQCNHFTFILLLYFATISVLKFSLV